MQNNRILIVPVYEIFGDVDVNTGNIDFNGDVVIHGNIKLSLIIIQHQIRRLKLNNFLF